MIHVKKYLLLIVLALVVPGAALQARAQNMPGLVVKETTHDFGTITMGTPLAYSFKIKNEGTADLQIKSVVPS